MVVAVGFILVCATILLALLAFLGFTRSEKNAGTIAFAWLCIGSMLYTGGYLGEILSSELRILLFFTRVQYTGLSFIPPLLIIIAMEFDGRWANSFWAKTSTRMLFFVPSLITYFLILSIENNDLYYVNPVMTKVDGFSILSLSRGPWYTVQLGFLYFAFVFAVGVFVMNIRHGNHVKKIQAKYMVAGGLLPMLGNLFYLYIGTPYSLDVSPLALSGTSVFFALCFLRHRVFDLAPLARDAVFDQMRDAIVVVDEKNRLVDFNSSARILLPELENKAMILGMPIDLVMDKHEDLKAVFKSNTIKEIFMNLGDGTSRQFEPRLSRLEDVQKHHRGRVLTLMDVSDRAAMQAKLKELAQIDDLTGLHNRRHFLDLARIELERAKRYGRPFSVALMDLNRFKYINDTWGHAAGDEALRLVSRLCKNSLRTCDLFGRYGGDEFAFAFPECDERMAEAAAEKITRVVSQASLTLNDQVVPLSASIGTAGSRDNTYPDMEDLMASADTEMYRKKKAEH